jgi:hypothetical protein|tara:strand:- start:698 stop:856 length:159 start_codon:yes stop_codon:yes gene_type:complete
MNRKFTHEKIITIAFGTVVAVKLTIILFGLAMIINEGIIKGGFNNATFGIAG